MRVFTPTELYGKQIPRPGEFLSVIKALKEGYQDIYLLQRGSESTIPLRMLGAIVIGSMARLHDMACTSDIDVVVFYDDSNANEGVISRYAKRYRERYTQAMKKAEKYNVPINVYNVFLSQLQKRTTRHTKQFLKHAIVSMDGFGGTRPTGLLAGDEEEVRSMFETAPDLLVSDARAYMVTKKESLRDGYFSWGGLSHEKVAKLYAQAFNSPFHAARQVLDVRHVAYEDTKPGVIAEIAEISPITAFGLQALSNIGSEYGKGCEAFRDDTSNKLPAPTLQFESVYSESVRVLDALRAVL
jgi:hypothetical protein